ncbi:MAG: hypothetical protein JNM90_00615 [Burkholderiales bacterium]|nr:hypothetical protein [Burkholderiales bacterium]
MKCTQRMRAMAALAGVVLVLAGCAEMPRNVQEARELLRKLRGREPAPAPPAPPPAAQIPAPAAAGMNINGNCVGRDETGYAERARIEVAAGVVRALDARIDIPNRGSCTYRLAEFRQTRQTPYVELLANAKASCALRMWQQGDRITFAATDCAEKCTRGAFDYAWPIEFKASGECY